MLELLTFSQEAVILNYPFLTKIISLKVVFSKEWILTSNQEPSDL